MSDKAKRAFGIILIVLLAIVFTLGFAFIGVVYGGYSFGLSLLIPLGAYAITLLLGALIWLIVYLLDC